MSRRHVGGCWAGWLAAATFALVVLVAGGGSRAEMNDDARPGEVIKFERALPSEIWSTSSRHLTLYTDVSRGAEIERLGSQFDMAVEQFCRYFGVDPESAKKWHMTGCLMVDKKPFAACGLLPADLPEFRHGYSVGDRFWLYEQPSEYYRRHLLLHEAVHGFMNAFVRRASPPWYREGIAELLATHRLERGELSLRYFPARREEVPMWGRIRIIQDAVKAGGARPLDEVLELGPRAHLEVEPYAWCWAVASLLDSHPRYRERFRRLRTRHDAAQLDNQFRELYATDWTELCEDWQLFQSDLEYGYDVERMAVDWTPGRAMSVASATIRVAADRGWQSSGLLLEGGQSYRLQARGRYELARDPRIWWCEPSGVSIRYYKGRPLGVLLAAVRPQRREPHEASTLAIPTTVGLDATLTAERTGTLYLRINDSAAELADNAGTLEVEIKQLAADGRDQRRAGPD